MQKNILWTGVEYYSLENCLVDITASGTFVNSAILGKYQEKFYRVEYRIRTDENWNTMFADISCQHDDIQCKIILESDGQGNWQRDGKIDKEFGGCMDIDIPVTPFTNTLPIRRLNLLEHEEKEINVIYLDVLAQKISAVRQQYTRVDPSFYHYQNVPNDFEAKIEVDEDGFVKDYPGLFTRTGIVHSRYPSLNVQNSAGSF